MSLPAVSLCLFNCKCQRFGSGRGNHTGNEAMGKMDWRGPRRETLSAADQDPLGAERPSWKQGGGSRDQGKEGKMQTQAGRWKRELIPRHWPVLAGKVWPYKCSWKGTL